MRASEIEHRGELQDFGSVQIRQREGSDPVRPEDGLQAIDVQYCIMQTGPQRDVELG